MFFAILILTYITATGLRSISALPVFFVILPLTYVFVTAVISVGANAIMPNGVRIRWTRIVTLRTCPENVLEKAIG